MSSASQSSQASVLESAEARQIETPDFFWDCERVGPGCCLGDPYTLCNGYTKPGTPKPYNFAGTRGCLPLTGEDLVYWEVIWTLSYVGSLAPGVEDLLRLGVATEDVLTTAAEGSELETLNEAGITMCVGANPRSHDYYMWARCGPRNERRRMTKIDLETVNPIDARIPLCFLFDGPKATVYLFSRQPLKPYLWWRSPVDVSQPLYPFACLGHHDKVGKTMSVRLNCAWRTTLTEEGRQYLEDLIGDDQFRVLTTPKLEWDTKHVGPGCSVQEKIVSNNPGPLNADSLIKFPGICVLLDIYIEFVVYWELWWNISEREPGISTSKQSGSQRLLQLGIAPSQLLVDITDEASLEQQNVAGVTLLVEEDLERGDIVVRVTGGSVQEETEDLVGVLLGRTGCSILLGFLFDGPRSTLWLINAWSNKVVLRRKVTTTQLLTPFVCLAERKVVGREIIVVLNSEELSTYKKALLRQLLRESN